ncbi:MAG: adenylate/guanylate cyclase domain-containing protein [Oscillatoria sp. PMC 1051.18]|nr:adenylate/guanylate cyclase domain-containing protein [Oscillatoria sp. PMC 1050.18]MEC5032313.1 adenylate/guanylate cyclase domain-containing protein [Oscillatoria sp. PMC 1051.18]
MLKNQPCILLVDDDSSNLLLLEELMAAAGYQTVSAASGKEALEIVAKSTPELILLDIMMPGMDGFEVCSKLRENPQLQAVPIVFLTALDDENNRLRGLETMGDDYITKPINSQFLLTKIKNIFRLQEMRNRQAFAVAKQESERELEIARRVNQELAEKFRRFVPEKYLARIAPLGVNSIQIGNATEAEVTILFCDIREFTAIAESQPATTTYQWLNEFFTRMSEAIATENGFVDKFLGDAIMAVFDRHEQHPRDALNAAMKMVQSLESFNQQLDRYNLDLQIKVGIGIHTGKGIIGTVGSRDRMDSTIIGDVVNTAARLEELTKTYKCAIVTSAVTIAQLPPGELICCRFLDKVKPRGKQEEIEIYEVVECSSAPRAIAEPQSI